LILLYHRIAHLDRDPQLLAVTPERFDEHLEILRRKANVMPLKELVQKRDSGLPPRSVAITFDDGYADNLLFAKPLLERHELPATVFVTTGFVGVDREFWWDELDRILLNHQDAGWNVACGNDDEPRHAEYRSLHTTLRSSTEPQRLQALHDLQVRTNSGSSARATHRALTPDQLRELAEGGLVEVGAHTVTHPVLASLPPASQHQEIDKLIEHIKNKSISQSEQRQQLDLLRQLNEQHARRRAQEAQMEARIQSFELAYGMQMDATDAMDIRKEPETVRERYGSQAGEASFASNCLVARRLAERGVRFIQLYHWGWDSHGSSAREALNIGFAERCRQVDQPIAALLEDLKERGMLEETLVVWGGEFGRTSMRENRGGQEMKFIGRDHNPGAFTIWMAGGGVRPGMSFGQTDELGYEIAKDPVEVRDLHATMLYLLGFDYRKLNYPFQGLEQKLTGVKPARVVAEVVA